MYDINLEKQLEVVRWLMYAWDGQWVSRTNAIYGPTEASKLNGRVRNAFGKIEMKALLALLGKKQADNLADAAEMLKSYFKLAFGDRGFQGNFQSVQAAPSGAARLQIEITRLTALDTLKKVAQAAGENPDLACETLWNSWLEALLPEAQIQVTMRSAGTTDLYQIDSLNEVFSGPAIPTFEPSNPTLNLPLPDFSLPAQTSPTFPPPFATSPAQVAPPTQTYSAVPPPPPAPAQTSPTFPPPFASAPPRRPATTELSPIAEALRIPLENIAPEPPNSTQPTSVSDPYRDDPMAFLPTARSAAPMIGSSEPGAETNLNQGLGGRLNQVPTSKPETTPQAPAWQALPPTEPEPPPVPLGLDPSTGRPLFSSTPEFEAREKVSQSKPKNAPLMSRLFMSKEGRELVSKGTGQPSVKVTSLASNIDLILQRRLQQARRIQPGYYNEQIRVVGGPEGELQIVVGQVVYQSVNDVPPGPIREILQQSVGEWSDSQQ